MTDFWNNTELTQMHIELTNACNAACPMCVRFFNNSPLTRPNLEIGQITVDKFKQYFPPNIIKQCNLILFCGVHGDPCTAKDMLEICEYIDSVSDTTAVRVNTNGGMRRSPWWSQLGKLFAKHSDKINAYWAITFSIDGLQDTNHLYRRNVNWDILMENVSAYIDAGGLAIWDFLIFKHNEHQILEARDLSEKMNFNEFVPKKALGVDNGTKLRKMPVMNKDGQLDYIIEAPTDPKNRNLENPDGEEPLQFWAFDKEYYRNLKEKKQSVTDYKKQVIKVYEERIDNQNFDYVSNSEIQCKSACWMGGKEIFVDNFGRVMPCCYIGTHLNGEYNDPASLQLHHEMDKYGWDNFSLEKYTLEEILTSGHLNKVFADSWSKDSASNGKLIYCADTCGKKSGIDKIFSHELNDLEARKMNKGSYE